MAHYRQDIFLLKILSDDICRPTYLFTYLPIYLSIQITCISVLWCMPTHQKKCSKLPNLLTSLRIRCICRNPLQICDVWGFNALLPCSTREVNQTFQVPDINNTPILKGGPTPNGKIILQTSSAMPASRRLALPPEPAAISSSTALARH